MRQSSEIWCHTGRFVIGDTLQTRRPAAHQILARLHYVLTVKGNRPILQEQLHADYRWASAEHSKIRPGHGPIERRNIQLSPEPDLEFP